MIRFLIINTGYIVGVMCLIRGAKPGEGWYVLIGWFLIMTSYLAQEMNS